VRIGVFLAISVLALTVFVQTANAAVTLEGVRVWYWYNNTSIDSVAVSDVDSDGQAEIVTGGIFFDGTYGVAQLVVWDGATLGVENVQTWYWGRGARITSVAVGDVDSDGQQEIVTGGFYHDDTRYYAQLCIWNGATLTLETFKVWYWNDDTYIDSVAIDDVDADGQAEIITGGSYYVSYADEYGQLCVWNWNGVTLTLENCQTWQTQEYFSFNSVAVGDVDGDGGMEIVTGTSQGDPTWTARHGELRVWDGATLTLENVKSWRSGSNSVLCSVAVGNVDGDGQAEIVTGGYFDGNVMTMGHMGAELRVWDGAELTVDNSVYWYWGEDIFINSVAVGDVDGDGQMEIATGGEIRHWDGTPTIAQLCLWSGALALEDVRIWCWTYRTSISSVAIGNVDGDLAVEVVTGGDYWDGTRDVAQLCVW
jgi:hypothetical protein